MEELKRLAYEGLESGLARILSTSRTLIAESEIRNLNVGLCLLQCGLSKHPLARTSILGNKRYMAHWTNDVVMEKMLEGWLVSELLLTFDGIEDFQQSFIRIKDAAGTYISQLRKEGGRYNPYTFLMLGHLVRNMFLMKPDDLNVQEYHQYVLQEVVGFSVDTLQDGKIYLLDFCLSYFAGIDAFLPDQVKELRDHIANVLVGVTRQPDFWEIADPNLVPHMLMDLHIAGVLPDDIWERGIRELRRRIDKVLSRRQIDLQILTRLTRALGELSRRWVHIPEMLERKLTSVYSGNILDEIQRVVLDDRGVIHPDITGLVERVRRKRPKEDLSFLADLFRAPLANRDFRVSPELEYIDIVKPPEQTLAFGGDCDCIAAMYASLLLAAGFRKVDLFYLSKRTNADLEERLFHTVACLKKDDTGELGDEFYCFDPMVERNDGIPSLILQTVESADIISSVNGVSGWEVMERKELAADDYMRAMMKKNGVGPVRGLYIPPTTDREVVLRAGLPMWILLQVNDDGCIFSQLEEFMVSHYKSRRDQFWDIVIEYNHPLFDAYRNALGLDPKKVKYPALIICRIDDKDENGDALVQKVVLDKIKMRNLWSAANFGEIITELQLLSLREDFAGIAKYAKTQMYKQGLTTILGQVKDIGVKVLLKESGG